MSHLRQALKRNFWWIAVFWLAVGLILTTQLVVGTSSAGMPTLVALLLTNVLAFLDFLLTTPAILLLARRFPLAKREDRKNLPVHLAAALVISMAHVLWYATLQWAFNPFAVQQASTFRRAFYTAVMIQFHTGVIIYAIIATIVNMMDAARRLAQREAESARLAAELSKAQLDALRRQLEPHFLFNTLNGIAGLVRENRNESAVDMIAGLSDLLRRVIEDSSKQLVPLAEEVSFLESYIKLQEMRFGDRLKVTVDIPVELYGALVPPLVLQPLVENAIVHGVGKLVDGGEIRVKARECEGTLSIYLYNDGPALSTLNASRAGVGLSNTRGRLVTIYGAESGVELRNADRSGVETIVKVPYRPVAQGTGA